jgi:hypothetical protein
MPSTPSAYDPRWKEFRLTVLLKGLHEFAKEKLPKDEVEYEGSKVALKRARLLKETSFSNSADSLDSIGSATNTFLRDVAGSLGSFLAGINLIGKFRDGSAASSDVRKVLKKNQLSERALKAWEVSFRMMLPDLAEMDEKRWPGHVSYRAGLGHYVAVCLRAHSILPEVSFDALTLAAARRILVPALAHNFKFFAKDHPELYQMFVHGQVWRKRGFFSFKEEDGARLPGPSRPVFRKWARLFRACGKFGAQWGEAELLALCGEFQDLLQDYEKDPRSSRLWRDLSILAAGDMAVDEILVSWVIKDVGGDEASLSSSPLVNCARSRFGLLRYAYMMVKEEEIFRTDFEKGLSEARRLLLKVSDAQEGSLEGEIVDQAFGWAYLLSRNNLLGRKALVGDFALRDPERAGMILYDLLNELRFKAKSEAHRTLALRYLIGFMTNPRFIKPFAKIRLDPKNQKSPFASVTAEGLVTDARKMSMMPKSIVNLAMGRIALHHAFLEKQNSARNLQSSLGHFAAIIQEMDNPSRDGIMDGEVIAWALPEMHCAIQELASHDPESQADWEDVLESLQVLGEAQFGVFFNPKEEVARIKLGLEKTVGR